MGSGAGAELVELERLFGRALLGVRLSLFEEFVELLVEDVTLFAGGFEAFLKGFFAAGGFALEILDGFRKVLDGGGFFLFLVSDDGFGNDVDLQLGLTARTGDLHQIFHKEMLSQTDMPYRLEQS